MSTKGKSTHLLKLSTCDSVLHWCEFLKQLWKVGASILRSLLQLQDVKLRADADQTNYVLGLCFILISITSKAQDSVSIILTEWIPSAISMTEVLPFQKFYSHATWVESGHTETADLLSLVDLDVASNDTNTCDLTCTDDCTDNLVKSFKSSHQHV